MNKRSYVFLADGLEEIEALTPIDVMRRAGLDVKTVSVMPTKSVVGAHGVKIEADMMIGDEDMSDAQWLVLPGGMPGASNLAACEPLCRLLVSQQQCGGKIAAICASPAVLLASLGILDGVEACCYPGFEDGAPAVNWQKSSVVETENIITGNGPGAAMSFALAIVRATLGKETADQLAAGMMVCCKA